MSPVPGPRAGLAQFAEEGNPGGPQGHPAQCLGPTEGHWGPEGEGRLAQVTYPLILPAGQRHCLPWGAALPRLDGLDGLEGREDGAGRGDQGRCPVQLSWRGTR